MRFISILSMSILVCCYFNVSARAVCDDTVYLSQDRLDDFREEPELLLKSYQNGTRQMAFAISDYAQYLQYTMPGLKTIIRKANEAQASAIGLGLANAYRKCQVHDSNLSQKIASLATGSGNPTVVRSFRLASSSDDDPIGMLNQNGLKSGAGENRDNYQSHKSFDIDENKLRSPFAPLPSPFAPPKV